MQFLISDAMAQNAPAAGAGGLLSFAPLLIIFVLFYFLLIRPQQKRTKQHKEMVEGIAKGDEIVTSGGALGKVTDTGDNFITVEIADGVSIKVQRHMVAQLMPKGTVKSA